MFLSTSCCKTNPSLVQRIPLILFHAFISDLLFLIASVHVICLVSCEYERVGREAAPDIKLFIGWPQWQVQLHFIPQSTIAALSKHKLIIVELTAQVFL